MVTVALSTRDNQKGDQAFCANLAMVGHKAHGYPENQCPLCGQKGHGREECDRCAPCKQPGHWRGFPGDSGGKESACSAGAPGLIPGSGRSPGEGNGCPLPVFLPGESHGQEPGGLQSRGPQEWVTTERHTGRWKRKRLRLWSDGAPQPLMLSQSNSHWGPSPKVALPRDAIYIINTKKQFCPSRGKEAIFITKGY